MHTETNGNIDHTWNEVMKDTPKGDMITNDTNESLLAIQKIAHKEVGENSEMDISGSDKLTSNIVHSSINNIQVDDNEIQVQNSQKFPPESFIPENQSSPHVRTPRLNKLRNFFKDNRSPTKRNSPTKAKEKKKKISIQINNTPSTSELISNVSSENNLDTQNVPTELGKQVSQFHSDDKTDIGNILDDFDNSPPDTPESQRVLPESNLKEIKDLIASNVNGLETKS